MWSLLRLRPADEAHEHFTDTVTSFLNELNTTDDRLEELRRLYELALGRLDERNDHRDRIHHLEEQNRQAQELARQLQDRYHKMRIQNRRLLEQNSSLRAEKQELEAGCEWHIKTIERLRLRFAASTLRALYMYSDLKSLDLASVENKRLRKKGVQRSQRLLSSDRP